MNPDVTYAMTLATVMRALFRERITKHLPNVKCRVRTTGATVAVVVLDHDNELWPQASKGGCQVRELLDREFPNLPIGFYSVSYEHYV